MNAASFARRSVVRLVYVKSMSDPLRELPAALGHGPRLPARLGGEEARRGPVLHPLHDALRDAGGTEEVVREVEIPGARVDRRAPHPAAIHRDVFRLGGNAQRRVVDVAEAAEGTAV